MWPELVENNEEGTWLTRNIKWFLTSESISSLCLTYQEFRNRY